MRHAVKLPKLGDTAEDVIVLDWLAQIGDRVAANDAVLLVETSKVDAEVVSPVAGTLIEHLVAPGDEVAVGEPIAIVQSD
jgi:pyruvate/2-oxoglutarate dehydrogenase complex dihydrolipoamide acyltransferase (E2) component